MNSIKERFKEVKKSKVFDKIFTIYNLGNKKVLDLGCGFGEHLINFGKQSVGITTAINEVNYGKENNLDIRYGNVEKIDEISLDKDFDVIWANNLFEHILSPHSFLMNLKKVSKKDSILILGVPVIPKLVFLLNFKKFRGSLASNHINFFTKESLVLTTERAGWDILTLRPFVFKNLFLDNLASFVAPHLYVVAKNNTSFVYNDKKLNEWVEDPYYQDLLKITHQTKG